MPDIIRNTQKYCIQTARAIENKTQVEQSCCHVKVNLYNKVHYLKNLKILRVESFCVSCISFVEIFYGNNYNLNTFTILQGRQFLYFCDFLLESCT